MPAGRKKLVPSVRSSRRRIIAAAKTLTGLPVIVDASHGTGRADLVLPVTLAGIAAGADGFLIEVHPHPDKSLSDKDQAYPLSGLSRLIERVEAVWRARG